MATNKTISKKEKDTKPSLPTGAKILSKSCRIEIEEIENGFVISKNYEVRYETKEAKYPDYKYWTEKYYTKDEPMISVDGGKSLADIFND